MDTCDITREDWEVLHNSYVNGGNVCAPIKIQDSVPFQYSPEMTNINLRWLYQSSLENIEVYREYVFCILCFFGWLLLACIIYKYMRTYIYIKLLNY